MEEADVILDIENTHVKCNKNELMRHSDYFKVMFEGNFIERHQKVIKLEGIRLKAMNIILSLLWDGDNTIVIEKEEDVWSVLQASSMLQFNDIKRMCADRLTHLLCSGNCLKVWLLAEQLDLRPHYLKAKNMALIEFETVKDAKDVLELDLSQLVAYLSNTCLKCSSELDVFRVGIKWWYENSGKVPDLISEDCLATFKETTMLQLLSCLDFTKLTVSDIRELTLCPGLMECCNVMNVLNCIIDLKNSAVSSYDERIISRAKMLNNSRPRQSQHLLCILLYSSNENHNNRVGYHDIFKRKRYYANIESLEAPLAVAYYDEVSNKFKTLVPIERQKCAKLEGFQIVGYRELIFLIGGEFELGCGNWNKNLWVFNTITDCWERRSLLPFARRHFDCCICDDYLFVIGGTGNFRVIQDNIFWYNYRKDEWSKQIKLPCCAKGIKCCIWKGQLFVFSRSDVVGYLLDMADCNWIKLKVSDENHLVLNFPTIFSLYSNRNNIYIKGDQLIEMAIEGHKVIVQRCKSLQSNKSEEVQSVVSGDIVYTLHKHSCVSMVAPCVLSLEKFNMDTESSEFIFKNYFEGTALYYSEAEQYMLGPATALLAFQHHNVVVKDKYVNDLLQEEV